VEVEVQFKIKLLVDRVVALYGLVLMIRLRSMEVQSLAVVLMVCIPTMVLAMGVGLVVLSRSSQDS